MVSASCLLPGASLSILTRSSSLREREREVDGIICFGGEDWWYHNRGHYDMQMMRELSWRLPVLYVNSIGMRVPRMSEGGMFVRRIARKLRSVRRGLVRVRETFSVLSPIAMPGRVGTIARRRLLPAQVRAAARQVGIRRPLVWIACPPGFDALRGLNPVAIIYQRTDRFECFHGVDHEAIARYDRELKAAADLTLFCSSALYEAESGQCRRAVYVDHGVDYERFARAGEEERAPTDVATLARPRVGFIGGIDAHTFDPALFAEVARQLPQLHFILVGACSLSPEMRPWRGLANVAMLGQKPYEDVPAYMAACDVLIMPWNRNEWIEACNPVKLKEYLAVGRPVVSTPFPELRRYEGLVRIAGEASSFAEAIRAALREPGDAEARRARVREETWSAKAKRVADELATVGVVPSSARLRVAATPTASAR